MDDPEKLTDAEKDRYITIWSKAVDTQMHFNEMSVKARQFGLGFVAASLGLGVVLLSHGQEASIQIPYFGGITLHATVLIAFASAMSLHAVRVLDLNVYHKMLRGSVAFGEDFEQTYMREIFSLDKGMTQAISQFSRYDDAKVTVIDGKYKYSGRSLLHAADKIRRFYTLSIWSLIGLGVGLFLATANLKFLRPEAAVDVRQAAAPQFSQESAAGHTGNKSLAKVPLTNATQDALHGK